MCPLAVHRILPIFSRSHSLLPAKGFRKSTRILETTLFRNNTKAITRGYEELLPPFDPVISQSIPKRITHTFTEKPGNVGWRDIEMRTQIASTQGRIGEMSFQICVHPVLYLATRRKAALEQFVDGGTQVVYINGFEEDVPSTVFHCSYHRLEAVGFRQDDEVGAYELLPDGPHNLQTVEVRQVDVQNGDVNARGTDGPERFSTVPCSLYAPRLRRQQDDSPDAGTNSPVAVRDEEPDTPVRIERRLILVRYD